MSKSLTQIDTDNDTFAGWVVKTNSIFDLIETEVVTANSHANGAVTTGNGYVEGTFGATSLTTTTLKGGNTVANAAITISTNAVFTDSSVKLNPGATYGANSIVHDHGLRVITSGTSQQNADTFAIASWRSAKYVVSVTDVANSKYQVTEIILVHDGTNTYSTEYATIASNTALATFASDITAGVVRLLVTPAVSPLQINIARTLVSV